ncbi:putative pterin-binding protein [Alsobacter sp. R-9]
MLKTAFAAAVAAFVLTVAPARADGLPRPEGKVVLTVSGAIEVKNAPEGAVFDIGMLEKLPGRVTAVNTPWYTTKTTFEGPLGSAILDAVGARGQTLRIVALNDYAAEIPVEDFKKWPVILATKLDGKPMSVREKGPLFVIYPFDADASLFNEKYFNRSVWQVKSIEVR